MWHVFENVRMLSRLSPLQTLEEALSALIKGRPAALPKLQVVNRTDVPIPQSVIVEDSNFKRPVGSIPRFPERVFNDA